MRLFRNEGVFGGLLGHILKLGDFKTLEKVGGEEALTPLKSEAKIKINRPQHIKEGINRSQLKHIVFRGGGYAISDGTVGDWPYFGDHPYHLWSGEATPSR
jgi:hypothetical protein